VYQSSRRTRVPGASPSDCSSPGRRTGCVRRAALPSSRTRRRRPQRLRFVHIGETPLVAFVETTLRLPASSPNTIVLAELMGASYRNAARPLPARAIYCRWLAKPPPSTSCRQRQPLLSAKSRSAIVAPLPQRCRLSADRGRSPSAAPTSDPAVANLAKPFAGQRCGRRPSASDLTKRRQPVLGCTATAGTRRSRLAGSPQRGNY